MHHVSACYLKPYHENRDSFVTLREVGKALLLQAEQDQKSLRKSFAKRMQLLKKRVRSRAKLEGLKLAKAHWQTLLERQEREYSEIIHTANRDCLKLTLQVIQRFLETNLEAYIPTLAKHIDEALGALSQEQPFILFVHPEDIGQVSEHLLSFPTNSASEIVSDQSIERGCARLLTRSGELTFSWRDSFELLSEEMGSELEAKLSLGEQSSG